MRTVKLPAVDEAKRLIGELDIRDIESVIQYSRFWLAQLKKREKTKQLELQANTQKAAL